MKLNRTIQIGQTAVLIEFELHTTGTSKLVWSTTSNPTLTSNNVSISGTSQIITGLINGTTYYFRIANTLNGNTTYSNEVDLILKPNVYSVSEFQTIYPHLNWIGSANVLNITYNQEIPIANAIQVAINYKNRLGVPFSSETGYLPKTSAGFSNNYITFNILGGGWLVQKNN